MRKRLYLKVGDKVTHIKYSVWGIGEVIEEKHSSPDGGCCLVKILFADGKERSFLNDMDNGQLICLNRLFKAEISLSPILSPAHGF